MLCCPQELAQSADLVRICCASVILARLVVLFTLNISPCSWLNMFTGSAQVLIIKSTVCDQVGLLLARHCDHYVTTRLSEAPFAAENHAKCLSEGPGFWSGGSQRVDRSQHDLEGHSSSHSHDQNHRQNSQPATADVSETPGAVIAPCECCKGGSLPTDATCSREGRWKPGTLQRTILESPCPKVQSSPLLKGKFPYQKCCACLRLELLPVVRH